MKINSVKHIWRNLAVRICDYVQREMMPHSDNSATLLGYMACPDKERVKRMDVCPGDKTDRRQ
ncbi:hypothetical protein [uncultured Alistipes sp.]|jgi:hypothetical protein|uniref:hypothetical protein n=1 Tax=uncultured Alistipes sp. TaxID=538949 RepID=UPI0025D57FFD|nr:hypothetical protein [uncultured Alistipes sp.]